MFELVTIWDTKMRNDVNIAVRRKKVLPLYNWFLTPILEKSPLMVHNPPLFLYLYTLESLSSWIIIFLTLLTLNHTLDTQSFSWPSSSYSSNSFTHLLFSSPHVSSIMISTVFLNTFAWLLLSWFLWSCSYCAFLNVLILFSI